MPIKTFAALLFLFLTRLSFADFPTLAGSFPSLGSTDRAMPSSLGNVPGAVMRRLDVEFRPKPTNEQMSLFVETNRYAIVIKLDNQELETPKLVSAELDRDNENPQFARVRLYFVSRTWPADAGVVVSFSPPEGKKQETEENFIAGTKETPPTRSFKLSADWSADAFVGRLNASGTQPPKLSGRRVSQQRWSLEAALPLDIPEDVAGVAGASKDSSGKVSDLVSGTFQMAMFDSRIGLSHLSLTGRMTGEGRGREFVVQGGFSRFARDNRSLAIAQLELGLRSGETEWTGLTTKAPNRGDLVARLAFQAEWMPIIQVGKSEANAVQAINADLSDGLRWFVRARGWLDYVKGDSGDQIVRFRPFMDSELFWNFSKGSRIFLRFEHGYLPPDLSRKTQNVFLGIGKAF